MPSEQKVGHTSIKSVLTKKMTNNDSLIPIQLILTNFLLRLYT